MVPGCAAVQLLGHDPEGWGRNKNHGQNPLDNFRVLIGKYWEYHPRPPTSWYTHKKTKVFASWAGIAAVIFLWVMYRTWTAPPSGRDEDILVIYTNVFHEIDLGVGMDYLFISLLSVDISKSSNYSVFFDLLSSIFSWWESHIIADTCVMNYPMVVAGRIEGKVGRSQLSAWDTWTRASELVTRW